jgi:hypothetical protein
VLAVLNFDTVCTCVSEGRGRDVNTLHAQHVKYEGHVLQLTIITLC